MKTPVTRYCSVTLIINNKLLKMIEIPIAGKITIVEVDEIVEPGEIDPNHVVTPGVFVNYIVKRPEGMVE